MSVTNGSQIGIDTGKVVAVAQQMIEINNRLISDFSAVEEALKRLGAEWSEPSDVAAAAFKCFDEIKTKYFDPTVAERCELAQFLCDAVGIGYENTENQNKKVLEGLFDVGETSPSIAYSKTQNSTSYTSEEKSDDNLSGKENQRISDVSNNKYFNSYNNGNLSGYKYQCVSYVYGRLEEKLGIDYNGSTNYAKDAAVSNRMHNNAIISADNGKQYRVNVYEETSGEHIAANSWVSFGANSYSPTAGHIIYVEDVVVENCEKYVYFTHGGQSLHSSGNDGVLYKQKFSEFVNRPGGCVGVITFSEVR